MIFGKTPRPKGPDEKKPILFAFIVLMGLALAVLAQAVLGNSRTEGQLAIQEVQAAPRPTPAAPAALQAAIETLGGQEQGKNGVLIRSVEDDWVAGYKGATTFSQGTLRRVWLGTALLDAVDHGELSLDQQVPLLAARRTGQQPKARVGDLLNRAVQGNDREAQDHVLDGLTGPAGMGRWLHDKGIDEVAYGPSNRDMARLPARARATFHASPPDGATPDGMAFGLSELFVGRLLSENSAQLLIGYFTAQMAPAGHDVAPGWKLLYLTGETAGGDKRPIAASGAALVRSRTGHRFVIVVFADGAADTRGRRDRLLIGAVSALEASETR